MATNNDGANESAVALVPTPAATDAGSSGASAGPPAGVAESESGTTFEAASKPTTYVPFIATHDWQVVKHDHILPPGLWIQFDFDGVARARLQPVRKEEAAAAATAQPQQEVAVDAKTVEGGEPGTVDIVTSSSSTAVVDTDSAASSSPSPSASPSPAAGQTSVTSPGPASTLGQSKRGFATSTRKVVSSQHRPVLYPVYPPLAPDFLAARPPLPSAGQPIISIAPMVDVTDRHFRYLLRLISKHVVLYTPMLVDNALLRAPLAFPMYVEHLALEHPVIAQLGGSEPETMVKAALICQSQGFQQINLNVGCPAPSASGHAYGCILMNNPAFPHTVRQIVDACTIPVTIKCRIGLNKEESFEFFCDFIERCWKVGGVTRFIVHARKAVLNLKTSKNLTVPPLKYDYVHRLKQKYPELHIEINGGFDDWTVVQQQLADHHLQGVMLGRHAWKNPYAFAEVERLFYGSTATPPTRIEVMEKYVQYAEGILEASRKEWSVYEAELARLQAIEAEEDVAAKEKATADAFSGLHITKNITDSACSSTSAGVIESIAAAAKPTFRPSELLPPPHLVDVRQLLRPVGYLYALEPGYKRFRVLFEDGLLKKEMTIREIIARAMDAVEPPPPREREWPQPKQTEAKEEEKAGAASCASSVDALTQQALFAAQAPSAGAAPSVPL